MSAAVIGRSRAAIDLEIDSLGVTADCASPDFAAAFEKALMRCGEDQSSQ